jgi:hypothetical protein
MHGDQKFTNFVLRSSCRGWKGNNKVDVKQVIYGSMGWIKLSGISSICGVQ